MYLSTNTIKRSRIHVLYAKDVCETNFEDFEVLFVSLNIVLYIRKTFFIYQFATVKIST